MPQPATPAKYSADAAYLKLRLETMDEQERASMEEFLKAKPGLTAEKYMEEAIAHGF